MVGLRLPEYVDKKTAHTFGYIYVKTHITNQRKNVLTYPTYSDELSKFTIME